MKILVGTDANGNFQAASLAEPIDCMNILDQVKYQTHYEGVVREKELNEVDLINFESYIENFNQKGYLEVINI